MKTYLILLLTLFIILVVIALFLPYYRKKRDELYEIINFEQFDNPSQVKEDKIDKLYCKLYDQVFNEQRILLEESKAIIDFMNEHPVKKSKNNNVLDVGSGTGKHYQYLSTTGNYTVMGLERSENMISLFKIRNPLGQITHGDMRNEGLFKAESFSYIICLKDTLYHNQMQDWDTILSNFYFWLKPEGYLIINIYDRENLDPAPRNMSFIRHDAEKRKHSITNFPNFTHDGWWENRGKVICQYNEIYAIRDNKGQITKKRHYKHNLVIPDKDKIMKKIVGNYFKLIDVKEFNKIGVIDHQLCFFKKNKF